MSKKLFEGIRVIDFSNNVGGPLCASIFADFGADVIKVEKPGTGDDSRGYTPYVEGISYSNLWLNRGKKSICLDVKNPAGKEIFLGLLKDADILIESSRPGVMARLGLSWEELHPKFPQLIMVSISGFGQYGPYKDLPGYDMIAQAVSGLIDTTGYAHLPAVKLGPSICDFTTGYNAYGALASALYYREKCGVAQYIDLALADCALGLNDYTESAICDPSTHRNGNHHVIVAPYGIFSCEKGDIALSAINPKLWDALCTLMGKQYLLEDPDLDTSGKRAFPENCKRIVAEIEEWLNSLPDMDYAEKALREVGIPCAKITKCSETQYDPHYIEREMIIDFPTPQFSVPTMKSRGQAIKMSETPAVLGPGPSLNRHKDEILKDVLGYSEEDIKALGDNGAFGK